MSEPSINPTNHRSPSRKAFLAAGVAVAVVAVGAAVAFASADSPSEKKKGTTAAAAPNKPSTHSIQLSIAASNAAGVSASSLLSGQAIGSPCYTDGGYDDIPGASVVISDEAGKVIGVGTLPREGEIVGLKCEFETTISDVGPAKFYQLKISHRGAPTYTPAQLESAHWAIALEL